MKILITGATGFVGQPLVKRLLTDNHALLLLGRSLKKGLDPRVEFAVWRPSEGPAPAAAMQGVEAVVHLAGEPIAQRWTQEVKRRIRDSRVVGTQNLVAGLAQLDPRPEVLVCASAIGYYGDRGDEKLDERSPPGEGFLPEVSKEWEEAAASAEPLGIRVVQLRLGIILGKNGGALEKMLPPFRMGLGGPMGSGKQWMSWIHRDDVIGLIIHALENKNLNGPVNATAPNPVRNATFASMLGAVLERPAILPAPAFAIRLIFGEMSEAVLSGQQVLPGAARQAKYTFHFPSLRPALEDILK